MTIDEARSPRKVSQQLRDVAASDPDRLAIDDGDGPHTCTYRELDRDVDALRQRLVADLGPGRHRLGVRLFGVRPMMTTSLASLRGGFTSVPIDPTAPEDRVRFILDDVDAAILLSDVEGDAEAFAPRPVLDPMGPHPDPEPGWDDAQVAVTEPVAITFTSGSTGTPKGILLGPATRDALCDWVATIYPAGVRTGVISAGTVGMSESLLQASVHTGGTLVPYDVRSLGFGPMPDWIDRQRIRSFTTVPTVLRFLLPTIEEGRVFEELDIIGLGGEAAMWEDIVGIRSHLPERAVIHSIYGSTETGSATAIAITPDVEAGSGTVPGGRPVPGVDVEVIGDDGTPVPPGEVGEVVITSHAAGLGYWNRPDLTHQTFEVLPDGRRRVRTADAGRFGPDGLLELQGRLDHVVKVAGNRVALGEVEAVLRGVEGVHAAVIRPFADPTGNTRLAAFVSADPGATVTHLDVRSTLARRLPGYMLPDRTFVLDSLPMLSGGKVDRLSLPDPAELPAPSVGGEDPSGELEEALAAMWREILDLAHVGRHDDFFAQGGDSMRAARLMAHVERDLGIARRTSLILEASTIADLAIALQRPDRPEPVLLPVQVDGAEPPLFVVHGGNGGILFARDLARRLGDDQPVYGIQPPTLVDGRAAEATLEDLAARYVSEIVRIRPEGPYRILGLSFGGVVAYEMALQLQAAGSPVSLLGIGDSTPPGSLELPRGQRAGGGGSGRAARARLVSWRVQRRVRSLRDVGAAEAAREVGGIARRAVTRRVRADQQPWWERADAEKARQLSLSYGSLLIGYEPSTVFAGRPLLLRSTRRHPGPPLDDLGWGPFASEGIEVVDLDAPHDRLLSEPHVGEVAEAVRRHLRGVTTPA